MSDSSSPSRLVLGHISGAHGVKGWLRVHSYTEPPQNIFDYSPWYLEHRGECAVWEPLESRQQGGSLIVRLRGCEDRDRAEQLKGATINVERQQLPPAGEGEFYWHDLIGLQVEDTNGRVLGEVRDLMETGANDVLIVRPAAGGREEEILIPYIREQVIKQVEPASGRLIVDWDPDY